ncbi:ANTAR domain-containing protein [Nocardioides aurantiacus]|uniref:ANTAR domain-containing protein n=1 Tax=Nocardioides aurantiacus TaxID=86796 RepID=A0A3N2CXF4_9ACTN|nr:ANTAR domain-containing protein [Nocardioides aurantiacus]ROR91894.1 hypothetical protein EDD33_2774 [Nocardioides aurantiacus]
MRPIPQTVTLAAELGRVEPDVDVLADLQRTADELQALVPDCVGLSVTWTEEGLVFTLVASEEELAVLDAVQHLSECPEPRPAGSVTAAPCAPPLDEQAWQVLAQAGAARAVRSSVTVALTAADRVVGSVTLYAASDHAFADRHAEIAAVLGTSATDLVTNADLAFTTRRQAEASPAALRSHDDVDTAAGLVAAVLRVDPEAAVRRLRAAAAGAGITPEQLARSLVRLWG